MNIETLAVTTVGKELSLTNRLVPFFNTNDKEPGWDGYVAVYKTANEAHRLEDLLLRIPVQIKGIKGKTGEARISYSVKRTHLEQYTKGNPTVFFVVRMDKAKRQTIYYCSFTKNNLTPILQKKKGNKTISIQLKRFPTEEWEMEKLFLDLAGGEALAITVYTPAQVPLSDTDIFLYNAQVVGFFGRDDEIKKLNAFLTAPGGFRWWGVTAPGGAGKSRLGYEWGNKFCEGDWTVQFLKAGDYQKLDTLTEQNQGPLLLIADYARQHAAELGKWMETLCDAERDESLRLLLLDRDEGLDAVGETPWEKALYLAGNEVHLRRARYDRLLRLPKLDDGPLLKLIVGFAAALRARDARLPELTEEKAKTLLGKLGEIDGEFYRPLYAMILTDAYLRDPAAARWTREELLNRVVLREEEQLKNAVRALQSQDTHLDETLFQAALRLRRLATALGASGDRELGKLLELDSELEEAFRESARLYRIPYVEEMLLYLGLLRYEDGSAFVPALCPDLLGEYTLLHWLTDNCTRQDEKASFYSAVLQDEELRAYFQRLYADYTPLLNVIPERWERLLPCGLTLDDHCAALYSDLLYDGFDRCTDRAQRFRLLEETEHLAISILEETPAVGNIFNNLGLICDAMGDYSLALDYYLKTLVIHEKVLGTEHPDTATSYNNVGSAYYAMGDYPHALEYCQKDLTICEKVHGVEHPDTATSYNNVGNVFHAMGDYSRALEYYQKALTIREAILGEEHPDTATSYNNLGSVYNDMSDYPRALDYYQKALKIKKKVYGVEHPSTATSYNNLGSVYKAMGDYPTSLEYYQNAQAICKKVYGMEHPDTATSYDNLGTLYIVIGDYLRAFEYCQKALDIREKELDVEHPDIATSYNNIGLVYYKTGNYYKAKEYMQRAVDTFEKTFGTEHHNTQVSRKWLTAIEEKLK